MGYQKIPNLYKDQRVLAFKQVYALEKIHGTSAHVGWGSTTRGDQMLLNTLRFFSGGAKHEEFLKVFGGVGDHVLLEERFRAHFDGIPVTVYGEAYGGKMQGFSHTYGKQLRFIAFEVKIGQHWLSVPDAADVAAKLGFEFVPYRLVNSDLATLDAERDAPSLTAIKLQAECTVREGIVIRPPFEVTLNNGERLAAKHVADVFRETKSIRKVQPEKAEILANAQAVAEEYVTEMRLTHVLGSLQPHAMELRDTGRVIKAVLEDLHTEVGDEIEWSHEVNKCVGAAVGRLYKARVTKVVEA